MTVSVADIKGTYLNCTHGVRATTDAPERSRHNIHLFGNSYIFARMVPDAYTPASYLQRRCNSIFPELYRVHNYGVPGVALSNAWLQVHYLLPGIGLAIQPNDIVCACFSGFSPVVFSLAEFCQQKGCAFFFFLWPTISEIASPSPMEKDFATYSYRELRDHRLEDLPVSEKPLPTPNPAREATRKSFSPYPWFYDLQPHFERPHAYGEIFFDNASHMGPNGNRLIADAMFQRIFGDDAPKGHGDATESLHSITARTAEQILETSEEAIPPAPSLPNLSAQETTRQAFLQLRDNIRPSLSRNTSLTRWLAKAPRFTDTVEKIGAIVMNCNPMTMGHVHCIGSALRFVDGLYVFVVQDDKSYVPFKDRFAIVKRVCAYRFGDKVLVVPSGDFIISSFSFPGYFTKEKQEFTAADRDSSFDVAIFGAAIAPALRIGWRFVGDEPLCPVTREYNEVMRTMLPPMGVRVRVFPRKGQGDAPISASRVRALFQAGEDLEAIRPLVPLVTFHYLQRLRQRQQEEQRVEAEQ